MGFQQGLSGLNAAARSLDVIGNNVANASTVGFKASRAEFADVYAATVLGGGRNNIGIGVDVARVRHLFTQGNVTTTANPFDIAIQGEGFFRMDDNGTIKYSRNGQFTVNKDGFIINNNGDFLTGYPVNQNGQIVTAQPQPLSLTVDVVPPRQTSLATQSLNLDSRSPIIPRTPQGTVSLFKSDGAGGLLSRSFTYVESADGSSLSWNPPLNIAGGGWSLHGDGSAMTPAIETFTSVAGLTAQLDTINSDLANPGFHNSTNKALGAVAFDPQNTSTYTWSTSITLFDSLGNSHVMTSYYTKTASGTWEVNASINGSTDAVFVQVPDPGNPGATIWENKQPITTLVFNNDGTLVQTPTRVDIRIPGTGSLGAKAGDFLQSGADDLQFTYDLTHATQFGQNVANNSQNQDGYTAGRLTGFSIGQDGVISANYSNSQMRAQGQIVLASFTNPNGLIPVGGNNFMESYDSGQARLGGPGTSDFGNLRSQALEDSTVDLTQELVSMITAQRVYQANSQTIKTQDSIMQTIVNLR